MSLTPAGIQLGPVLLNFFGLILIAALIAGGLFARLRAREQWQATSLVIDLVIWGVLLGVIGARVVYVLNPPPSVAEVYNRHWFLAHPFDLQVGPLAVWSGGLSTAGALLGGIFGSILTLTKRRVNRWIWGDILAPAALLGISMAGWANIVNRHNYGPPTLLPWGLAVTNPVSPFGTNQRFHPTPAYVAIWALLSLFIVLWLENRHRLPEGCVLLVSLLIYVLGAFLADFLRLDVNRSFFGLTEMQVLSLIMVAGAGFMLLARMRGPTDMLAQSLSSSDAD